MRKIVSLLVMAMLCSLIAFAQTRTISGQVTDATGKPVPFASVTVKGTNNGVTADADGKFILRNVPSNATLVVSSVGFTQQEVSVGASDVVTVSLTGAADRDLTEVVVTSAFGIKKSARVTPFSSQVIDDAELTRTRTPQIATALAGKVAGVQFKGQSSAALDRSTLIRIRGGASIDGDVPPIYVVDGNVVFAPGGDARAAMVDINPDDIEELNVLKGANATALFGSQARGGAIVITTKKRVGRGNQVGIEVNSGVTADKVYILPKYQNLYAGGASTNLIQYNWQAGQPVEWQALDGKFFHDYTDDASWGPRISGQEYIPWYAWIPGHARSFQTASLTPQPDNARDYWQTGITSVNNIAVGKASAGNNYRISYTNQYQKGIIPYSYSNRNYLNASVGFDLNSHFSASADLTYVAQLINGQFDDEYANNSSGSFNQWFHRHLDMGIMKELARLKSPIGAFASWNLATNPDGAGGYEDIIGNYWYNFYSYQLGRSNIQRRDRLYGNASLTYKLNNSFRVKATVRKMQNTFNNETKVYSILEQSAAQAGYLAGYSTLASNFQRYDFEGLASYNQSFGDFAVSVNAGGNIQKEQTKQVGANTNNGLNVPDLYSIANSASQPSVSNFRSAYQVNSLFATGDLEWKKMVSLSWAVRQDWFSTLNPEDNSLFYPSFGAGFVFSEALGTKPSWFNFGKIFGSWGRKPLALAFNQLNFTYGVGQFQWNGNFLMGTPDTYPDPTTTGALVTTYEGGLDLRFLKNRLNANLVFYYEIEDKGPVSVQVPGATGFLASVENAARVDRYGIETIITASPVRGQNFNWDITNTFAYLIGNPVKEITDDVDEKLLSGGAFGTRFARAFLIKGKDWGILRGGGIKRNSDGLPVINPATGEYVADATKEWGSIVPKVTGGITNSFNFKNFDLSFLIDYQVGGKFFSLSEQWGHFSGLFEATAGTNDRGKNVRDAVADGGGVHVVGVSSVDEKTPIDIYLDAQTYFHQFYFNRVAEPYIHDLTFVKLREVSLGYRLPVSRVSFLNKFVNGATLSVIGRNLWLIHSDVDHFDPSEITFNHGEDGQFPGTRSIGVNLKLNF